MSNIQLRLDKDNGIPGKIKYIHKCNPTEGGFYSKYVDWGYEGQGTFKAISQGTRIFRLMFKTISK